MKTITSVFFAANLEPTKRTLLSRDEISSAHKWNLEDIYPSPEAFEFEYKLVRSSLPSFSNYKGHLHEPDTLAACLQERDLIDIKSSSLFAFARMYRDTDNANSEYQAMTTRITSLLSEVSAALSFIEPELLSIDEDFLTTTIEQDSRLKKYTFFIANLLRQKEHVLSTSEEALLAKASEICQAPSNIFTIMTNADLKFPETLAENGEKTTLTEGRYNQFIRSENRKVRQESFENLFKTYSTFRHTFAATYSSQIQSAIFQANARKYTSTLEAALNAGNIPTQVYDTVIDTATAHLEPLHEYVALKQKALNLESIHMYDLYTPLTPALTSKFSYDKGIELVKQALIPLGDDYLSAMTQGIDHGWIDIYESKGKRNGAYSWGVYGVHPFVLLNYDDQYNAVSTLAHELGHAMHSFYSNKTQPYIDSSYTIFCAEVASTVNENLLLDYMLETSQNISDRLYFLNQYLEQVRTTVYRQILFAEFEKTVHALVEHHEALTADVLEKIWLDLNRKYYGEAIMLDDALKIEWARIPHFYRPFYVYQYATGYAAATALAAGLQKNGQSAKDAYIAYLKSGGSDYSLTLLKNAGVDMSTSAPLEITLEKFKSRLNEFRSLLFSQKQPIHE